MPQATPSFTSTMLFDFTQPQMRKASSASARSAAVGSRLVTTDQPAGSDAKWCGSCTR